MELRSTSSLIKEASHTKGDQTLVIPAEGNKSKPQNNTLSILFIICASLLTACEKPQTALERIQASGELRFAIVASPVTYFKKPVGDYAGLEYELASLFAKRLGLRAKFIVVRDDNAIRWLVNNSKVHIGLVALGLIDYWDNQLQHGPPYRTAKKQLVYRYGDGRPDSMAAVSGEQFVLSKAQSPDRLLAKFKRDYPNLMWRETETETVPELLKLVNQGEITATIADSNWIAIYRHLYPELRVALDITESLPVAWVYQRHKERSLHDAILAFYQVLQQEGQLDRLLEQYYRHAESFDYVDTRAFLRKIETCLPRLKKLFQQAVAQASIDWLLLAAISYQESHWNPTAKSPTGVRGLMMLTRDTADFVDVDNRLNPEQSVKGGTRYLMQILAKLPQRINPEDRLWLALAAYNLGFGHLEDARILTQEQGGDPDKWEEVRQYLPLLADDHWHPRTTNGYARGYEAVIYVDNIQRYYDILIWKHFLSDIVKPSTGKPAVKSTLAWDFL